MAINDSTLVTVKDKLELFSQNTEVIRLLYAHHKDGGLANPIDRLPEKKRAQGSPQRLAELKRAGFIDYDEGKWCLELVVIDFVERIVGTGGEVNVQTIVGNKENLFQNIRYLKDTSSDDDKVRFANTIRLELRRMLKNIRVTLENLDFEIRDTYMTISDLEIKVQKLKDHLSYLERLDDEVNGNTKNGNIVGILPYLRDQLSQLGSESTQDAMLLRPAIMGFERNLASFFHTKRSIVLRHLRDYLGRVEKIDKPARKIEQICNLYLNGQLFSFSNAKTVLKRSPVPVAKIRDLKLSLVTDFPAEPIKDSYARALAGINPETGQPIQTAVPVSRKELHHSPPVSALNYFLQDVRTMFEAYRESGGEMPLSDFALAYTGYRKELTMPEKMISFLEALNQYRRRLNVSKDEFLTYEDTDGVYNVRKVYLKKNDANGRK